MIIIKPNNERQFIGYGDPIPPNAARAIILTAADIALLIKMDPETLHRQFREQLTPCLISQVEATEFAAQKRAVERWNEAREKGLGQ